MKLSARILLIACFSLACLPRWVLAHGDADMDATPGTRVQAALSATWRDKGAVTGDGVTDNGIWHIPGTLMGGEAYPVETGTSLDDASITLRHRDVSGVHGLLQISSHNNGSEAEMHHAYAGYTLSPGHSSLNFEAGRMAAAITPANTEHASERLFSEAPLALDVFLGRQLNDEGARLGWRHQGWIVGLESWRGSAFPATAGDDGGSFDAYLQHRGNHGRLSWYGGLWWLQADALNRQDDRYTAGHSHSSSVVTTPELWFDGRATLSGAFLRLKTEFSHDLVWMVEAQWLQLEADGTLRDSTRQAALFSEQNGGWLQTSLRYGKHEVAIRQEQLALKNSLTGAAADALAQLADVYNSEDPTRTTLLYAWHAADNLRLRLEWTRDASVPQQTIERVGLGLVWNTTLWSQ